MRAQETSRTREINVDLSKDCQLVKNNGQAYQNTKTRSHIHRITHDVVTSNYRARSRRGEIILNDFDTTLTEVDDDQCYLNLKYGDTVWEGTKAFSAHAVAIGDRSVPSVDTDYVIDMAVTDAHANVSAQGQEAQLLVSIAEAKKTRDSVTDTLRGVKALVTQGNDLRRDFAKGFLSPRVAAKRWLALRFAMRPLVYEAMTAVKACQAIGDQKYTTVYGFHTAEDSTSDSDIGWDANQWRIPVTCESSQVVSARAGVILKNQTNNVGAIEAFGISDILGTAFEVWPYSWLINYFTNISKYVQAWSPSFNSVIVGSFVTVRTEENIKYTLQNAINHPAYSEDEYRGLYSGSETTKIVRTQRYANPSLPAVPMLSMKLNAAKVGDILALLANSMSTSSRKGYKALDQLRI